MLNLYEFHSWTVILIFGHYMFEQVWTAQQYRFSILFNSLSHVYNDTLHTAHTIPLQTSKRKNKQKKKHSCEKIMVSLGQERHHLAPINISIEKQHLSSTEKPSHSF